MEGLYKSPLNIPRTGHELVTCYYPLRLDTYSGCSHNCVYCYAMDLLKPRGYWEKIRPADLGIIRQWFHEEKNGIIKECINYGLPVRMGGLTDCFQPIENKYKITKETLKILSDYNYPYFIVTKSDLPSKEEYLDILRNDLCSIQYTVTSLDVDSVKNIEPGAPPIKDRLKAMSILSEEGFSVIGRISPIFPNMKITGLKDMVILLKDNGAKHIIVEFFRGNNRMIKILNTIFKYSLYDYMKKTGYYCRVELKRKMGIYSALSKFCKNKNIGFSICSDGDPMPPYLNSSQNCCGMDHIASLRKCSKCVANEIYYKAKEQGRVQLDDMLSEWSPDKSHFKRYWKSGKMEKMTYGIKKTGNEYILGE